MKLRSHRNGPSTSGKNPKYKESSDEEDGKGLSSDSEFSAIGEEVSIEENEGGEMLDLNRHPDSGVSNEEISDSDHDQKVQIGVGSRKRRVTMRKKREVSPIVDWEEEGVGGNILNDEDNYGQPEIDFLGVMETIEKKKTKKKRKRKEKKRPTLMWEVWEEEQERWIESNMENDIGFENQHEVAVETAEAPSDLIIPLLRYQKEWLAWALKQEESATRGGILADEMGMGKTAQAIALVVAKREIQKAIGVIDEPSSSASSSLVLPKIKATLVICPLVAVIQWVGEIERFTSKGSNKVLVYHGANRGKSLHQFSEYDFVITTYSIVEAEYRKNIMPPKMKCRWCEKSFHEHKFFVHLKYFCGPHAVKTAKQSKQQKKSKIGAKQQKNSKIGLKTKRKSGKFNGGKKKGASKETVSKDSEEEEPENLGDVGFDQDLRERKSILHSVKWDRIILDEAHYIKDRRSNTTKAVLVLESSYKWALSGTPLQNRVGELYSLVRYLQIVPYSYYFCKDCDCRVLDYSSSSTCPSCPHKAMRHFCWWNKFIAKPIQDQGKTGEGQKAMFLLKHKILKNILLRRTKKGRAADLALPPRIVSLRRDNLDIKEEDYYKSLYNESQAQFNTYIVEGTLMNNYAHIFDLLTRLRQAVDHPYLVVYSSAAMARNGGTANAVNDEQVCGLCHDPVEDPVVTSCEHTFCKSCLIDYSASVGQVSCPSCSKALTVDFTSNLDNGNQNNKTTMKGFKSSSILNRIRLHDFQSSTKIDALREEIRFMVERDGSAKGIVFSQFTSFLDLIHYSLIKSGVECVKLVGSMTMGARDAAITKFTEDSDCRIFLMSLKAGGVALNLTVASHVFLMDPWWNPAVERQAQDRIHRIGQYKPIRIIRFVIENTIEERILKLQEKKELVFEGTVGGSSEALGKLTEADMKFLFVT